METLVSYTLSLKEKQEVLNALLSIETDYPQFDGDTYSSVDFSTDFETNNFYVTISGEALVEWRQGDFKFDCISNINVVVNSNDGEVELGEEFINQIANTLEFLNL